LLTDSYQPAGLSQAASRFCACSKNACLEITGMDAIHTAARGRSAWRNDRPLLIRAYLEKQESGKKVLIPDSAHGTNPATA